MTPTTDGTTAERGEQPPSERITVALIPKAARGSPAPPGQDKPVKDRRGEPRHHAV